MQSLTLAHSGQQPFWVTMLCGVSYRVFVGLVCFACQLCKNVQFALSAIHACSVLLLPYSVSLSLSLVIVSREYVWVVSISIDSISATVHGGCPLLRVAMDTYMFCSSLMSCRAPPSFKCLFH